MVSSIFIDPASYAFHQGKIMMTDVFLGAALFYAIYKRSWKRMKWVIGGLVLLVVMLTIFPPYMYLSMTSEPSTVSYFGWVDN